MYEKIPQQTMDSLKDYVCEHRTPGSFLYAVLCNDLHKSFFLADDDNRTSLFTLVQYIYVNLPSRCWGSKEKVEAYLNSQSGEVLW